jgi:ribosomal protein L37AE/L43A
MLICACGCGRVITDPRPNQLYYCDQCRRRAWDRRNAGFVCEHCGGLNRLVHKPAGSAVPTALVTREAARGS